MQRKVSLCVKQEGQKCSNMSKKQTFSPVPVEEFGDYVYKCHANDNEDFRDQYTVRLFCLLHLFRKMKFPMNTYTLINRR